MGTAKWERVSGNRPLSDEPPHFESRFPGFGARPAEPAGAPADRPEVVPPRLSQHTHCASAGRRRTGVGDGRRHVSSASCRVPRRVQRAMCRGTGSQCSKSESEVSVQAHRRHSCACERRQAGRQGPIGTGSERRSTGLKKEGENGSNGLTGSASNPRFGCSHHSLSEAPVGG